MTKFSLIILGLLLISCASDPKNRTIASDPCADHYYIDEYNESNRYEQCYKMK